MVADPDYESRSDEGDEQDSEASVRRSRDLRGGGWTRLPGTRREAEEVAALLGEADVAIHLGRDATENRVKSLSARRIIHLATHGFFLDQQDWSSWLRRSGALRGFGEEGLPAVPANLENPLLRSGLVFAGANRLGDHTQGEDGILTALEVSGLPLWGTDLSSLAPARLV